MGHRVVKRVPMDFGWPLDKVWDGYLLPDWLRGRTCEACGNGYSPEAENLHAKWYGHVGFEPAETGSVPLTPETPEVREFAERNVTRSPEFYGTGEAAIQREARRLIAMWNGQWSHHLDQDDVNALIEAGRLHDFTHTWTKGEGWRPRDPLPVVTAAQVNAWSIKGFGHDSINCHVAVQAKCRRMGVPDTCSVCEGHAEVEAWPGQRCAVDAWKPTDPPEGDGWQLWETTSEGSPQSPVFATAEELADWAAFNATPFADFQWSAEEWLESFNAGTTSTDTLLTVTARLPADA